MAVLLVNGVVRQQEAVQLQYEAANVVRSAPALRDGGKGRAGNGSARDTGRMCEQRFGGVRVGALLPMFQQHMHASECAPPAHPSLPGFFHLGLPIMQHEAL